MKNCSRIKVEVLQRHIDAGKRANPYLCPIALAVRETMKEIKFLSFIELDPLDVRVDDRGIEISGSLADTSAPTKILQFVENFDLAAYGGRTKSKPFIFYIK